MTTIITKNGTGVPANSSLATGELAVDPTNKRIYTSSDGTNVSEVGTNPSTLTVDTDTLVVDAATNRVGIGTASPIQKLDVTIDSAATGLTRASIQANAAGYWRNDDATTGNSIWHTYRTDAGSGQEWYTGIISQSSGYDADFSISQRTGSSTATERMRIDSSGNVGIGTDNPTEVLSIEAQTNPRIKFTDTGNWVSSIGVEGSTGAFTFENVDGTERMRIDSSGNVGIGTDNPSGKLDVELGTTGIIAEFRGADSDLLQVNSEDNLIALDVRNTSSGLDFQIQGSSKVRITTNGNVGIGTTSPSSYAGGSTLAVNESGGARISWNNSSRPWYIAGDSGSDDMRIGLRGSSDTTDVDVITATVNGNVGIGTDVPAGITSGVTALSISDQGNKTTGDKIGALTFVSGDGTYTASYSDGVAVELAAVAESSTGGAYGLAFATGSAGSTGRQERVRITNYGALGIGTTTPIGDLTVSEQGAEGIEFTPKDASTTGAGSRTRYYNRSGSTYITNTQQASSHYHIASTGGQHQWGIGSNTQVMTLDSNGNLLVGATSTSLTTGTGYKFLNSASNPTPALVGTSTGTGNAAWTMYSTGASAYRFYVSWNGTVYATSTSIAAISDATLKENVRDLDKGLDTILSLKPRRFDWKNGDGDDIMGFIAQEVEEVMPELVHDYKYGEDETKKSLKMGDMIPSMVKAIQEQQAMIEELKAEVAALKGA